MYRRVWEKLDKFYLILAIVLTLMAVMIVVAFRGIFSAFLHAYEIDQAEVQVDAKIDKDLLDETYTWLADKTSIPLRVRD